MSRTYSNERPRAELEPDPVERALRVLAWTGWIVNLLLLAVYWPDLPDRVPRHFGLDGEADAWGSRGWLVPVPVISLGLLALLGWIERRPDRFNYAWPITDENAQRQYRLARELVLWLEVICAWLLAAISLDQCRVALGLGAVLGGHLPASGLAALFVLLGIYLARARRAR